MGGQKSLNLKSGKITKLGNQGEKTQNNLNLISKGWKLITLEKSLCGEAKELNLNSKSWEIIKLGNQGVGRHMRMRLKLM